jgi:hypothetical protein
MVGVMPTRYFSPRCRHTHGVKKIAKSNILLQTKSIVPVKKYGRKICTADRLLAKIWLLKIQ